jgi:hypothetical protein
MRAKMEVALIFAAAITSILLYGNHLRNAPRPQILDNSKTSQSTGGKFSSALKMPGVGTAYVYNQDWPKNTNWQEEVKAVSMKVVSLYNQSKLIFPNIKQDEKDAIIKTINKNKKPLLVIIPEGIDTATHQTKLWVTREGVVLIEKTRDAKKTWDLMELPNKTPVEVPFLRIITPTSETPAAHETQSFSHSQPS